MIVRIFVFYLLDQTILPHFEITKVQADNNLDFNLINGWSYFWDVTDSNFSFGNKDILNV